MSNWTKNEIEKIAATDDLHISPFRDDGKTYGTPTWIWSVVVDGELFVRPYHGAKSQWYQSALEQKAGRITAAGITKEVSFAPADASLISAIDAAYKAKYKTSAYLAPMIAAGPRSTTIKIDPR